MSSSAQRPRESSTRLADVAPELARNLQRSMVYTPARFEVAQIRCETVMVTMRDGVRLATDLYLPPELPAPAIAVRTPYGKGYDPFVGTYHFLARRGYAVIVQDCRGTGASEPDTWDHYVREPEDSFDLVEWVSRRSWFGGFLGACGGSYLGQTQWQMAMHPAMSTIVPEVSGLGVALNTGRLHMFLNTFARSVGKGEEKVDVPVYEFERHMLPETLATGYFNEPLQAPISAALLTRYPQLRKLSPGEAKRWLWEQYCAMSCAERADFIKQATGAKNITIVEMEALPALFGHQISHDRHTLPHPKLERLCESFHAPVLLRTAWYDWGLNDALATWELLMRSAPEPMRSRCRLLIAPSSHNMPGYHEGMDRHPELHHSHAGYLANFETLLAWHETVREGRFDEWPTVIYYLMGANEWRVADAWPPKNARELSLYLGANGALTARQPSLSNPDHYCYDPHDPTPTVGGSIVSFVYPPGSVDVSEVLKRSDVLTYTTAPLAVDLDVVGPLRVILYASSSAVDTDFVARLTDVFPDGRAIQLQSALLRARYRNPNGEPELLEPGCVYRFEIDLWATANRFKAGHRLRLDLSSADFPKFDRNSNRGGEPGPCVTAKQVIHHDAEHPSQLIVFVAAGEVSP